MSDVLSFGLGLAVAATGALVLLAALKRLTHAQASEIVDADRRFEATFEQAAVAIAHLDADGRWLRLNARYCMLTGYARDELMRLGVDDITHPLDRPADAADRAAMIAGEVDASVTEKRYVRKDGRVIWVKATRSTVRDAAGRPEFFVAVVEEITERKAAQVQLTTGEAQYRAIFDSAVEAMAVIDAEGIIQSVNPSVARVFGYQPVELIGNNIKMLMPDAIASQHDNHLQTYRETGRRAIIGIGREVLGRRKDGDVFALDLSVAEWMRGGDTFFTGIMRDISARKRTEVALRESEGNLRRLQKEFAHLARVNDMGEMAAAIAHEINQPLTAIVNFLNNGLFIAAEGYSEDGFAEAEQLMRDASRQALRAGEIVRRLREFVGQGNAARTVERLEQLVDSAMALALLDARTAGILVQRMPGAGDAEVCVDAVQIQQVLVNLLRNAVDALAASAQDSGVLRLSVETSAHADGTLQVIVSDNGPGIAPALAERLFEPFVTTKPHGMGMGLSVCRRLIEAHGGTIGAESPLGGGAAFHFRLPRFEQIRE